VVEGVDDTRQSCLESDSWTKSFGFVRALTLSSSAAVTLASTLIRALWMMSQPAG